MRPGTWRGGESRSGTKIRRAARPVPVRSRPPAPSPLLRARTLAFSGAGERPSAPPLANAISIATEAARAGVAELVDAPGSKLGSGDRVSVRSRPPAPASQRSTEFDTQLTFGRSALGP